jgi:hypothetical protein
MISLQYLVLVGRVTFFSMLAAKLGWAKSCLVGVCYYMGGIFLPYQRMSYKSNADLILIGGVYKSVFVL